MPGTDDEGSFSSDLDRILERRRSAAYILAALSVVSAAGLTVILGKWAEPDFSAVYVLAVLISSWAGGLGPGFLSTILSALAIAFTQTSGPVDLGWDDVMRVALFIIAAAVVGSLSAQRRAALAELKRADRAKDTFLAVISHELRTPLASILGWSQVLRSQAFDSATVVTAAASIEQSARSQQRLIEDLLDSSRIVVGKFRVEMRPLDLVPILRESADLFRPEAAARGITFSSEIPDGICSVEGDGERLKQAVWNLLSNALKFTPPGGLVTVQLAIAASVARVIVSDTGSGIEAEILPFIFERFKQGTPGLATGGLGLGLAIARHAVEAQKGTIAAESPGPGKGSRFTVTMPLRPL
ncbi:MAG: HAMP domain-containing sensor histidine kinase [Acidobacteriota bacterium]